MRLRREQGLSLTGAAEVAGCRVALNKEMLNYS